MNETIVAIATGLTNQAISIIRISGQDTKKIISEIFKGELKNRVMQLGKIVNNGKVIDEVMVVFFESPKTFTGEEMAEIFLHGGLINTHRVLQLIISKGARLASKGEFSMRAFLNGKMDMLKAQGINDLINAQNEFQAEMSSFFSFSNKPSELISNLKNEILSLIAICEVNIDYPEYDDVEKLTIENLIPKLSHLILRFETVERNSANVAKMYEGIKTVILGNPNVGKSSLLNCFLGEDKAIVTSTPGTTRDIVEGTINIDGINFKLIDTAGIRKTKNEIEKMGIGRTIKALRMADLVIVVNDINSKEKFHFSDEISEILKNKLVIEVFNKKDILNVFPEKNQILISAKNKDIKDLLNEIKKIIPQVDIEHSENLWNSRQIGLVKESKNHLKIAINGLKEWYFPDTIIIDLQNAWVALESITGTPDQETLLNEIFSNFCLGK